ncbi:Pullulanase precursor [compost metagenome]
MKTLLSGLLIAVFCYVLFVPLVNAEGTDTTKVIIHYTPQEGDTKDWSIWVWGDEAEGARFPFTSVDENGVKTAEIELPGKFAKVGFVVSTEDWIKDGGDQFIDIVNGVGEAHVTGGALDSAEGSGNAPMLWLIVGPLLVIIYITVMEQLRRRRYATTV